MMWYERTRKERTFAYVREKKSKLFLSKTNEELVKLFNIQIWAYDSLV